MLVKQNIFSIFVPMISIDRHISQLLTKHDCVIVPEFGAFLSRYVSACYNEIEQVYMPPYRTLGFNPQVTMDDALLVTTYMKQYGISYKQALILMKDDIKKLKKRLCRKGQIYFGELGILYMDVNGLISFEPNESGIDDPENYGMIPLPISMLNHKEETITISINRNRIVQYIAAAVAIITMFVFVTPLSDHTFKNNIKASLGNFASPEHISMMQQVSAPTPIMTSGSTCNISPIKETIKRETVKINNVDLKKDSVLNSDKTISKEISTVKYNIIVASTPNKEKAKLAIKELIAKASFEYNIIEGNKRFRISIGEYVAHDKAQEALAIAQTIFPDAWILNN